MKYVICLILLSGLFFMVSAGNGKKGSNNRRKECKACTQAPSESTTKPKEPKGEGPEKKEELKEAKCDNTTKKQEISLVMEAQSSAKVSLGNHSVPGTPKANCADSKCP